MITLKGLIERCLAKDKDAFSEFVSRYKNLVNYSIRLRLEKSRFSYSPEDIKDISQNVFLEIWEKEKLKTVRDKTKIDSWLAIVSQNTTIDYIRKHRSWREKIVILDEDSEEGILDLIPSKSDPIEEIATSQLSQTLSELFDLLLPRERLVLSLNLLHNQTHRQIAKILNVSINTISTLIRRTKIKLRKELEKRGYKP